MAVRNRADQLARCVDSVAAQLLPDKEILVADGGSTDGSVEVIRERASAGQIAWFDSIPDSGIYAAWNRALPHARGTWICFLGADDRLWDRHVFSSLAPALRSASTRVVYGSVVLLSASGAPMYSIGEPWHRVRNRMRSGMCLPHPGAMHHRSLFEEHGGFDESFRVAGDYELLLRELVHREATYVPGIIVTAMGTSGISSHPHATLAVLREVRRAQRRNGIVSAPLGWMLDYVRAAGRLLLWRLLGERVGRYVTDGLRRLMGKRPHWTMTG